jgi:hypothetical protein
VDVAGASHDPARLREGEVVGLVVGGVGAAGAGDVVDRVGAAVVGVEPVRVDALDRVRVLARDGGDRVANERLVELAAVVHHHVEHRPRVGRLELVAVAGREHHLRPLLAGGEEALATRESELVVEPEQARAGGVGPAEVEEDDVVEHQPPDRDRLALGVDEVDLHPGDVAVEVRVRRLEQALLNLVAGDRQRPDVERLRLHLRRRLARDDCDAREDGDRREAASDPATAHS